MADHDILNIDKAVLTAEIAGYKQALGDSFTQGLLKSEDSVLAAKGRDHSLYKDVLRDDQVKSTLQQRRSALISKPWEVVPGAEDRQSLMAAEALTEALTNLCFTDAAKQMHYGLFYGYAVSELIWASDGRMMTLGEIKVREANRFGFDKECRLRLKPKWGGTDGELMPDGKFWTFSASSDHGDNPYGIGLAHWCYWPVYFKRNDLRFWLQLIERFGAPTVHLQYPHNASDDDKDSYRRIARALSSASGVTTPQGVVVDLVEATRGGNPGHKDIYDRMDRAISKIVLSQTMTTDDGSSRSQAEVHEDVADDVVKDDGHQIADSFNKGAALWFTQLNFPNAERPSLRFITEEAEDLASLADLDTKLYKMGYRRTAESVREKYGEGYEPVTITPTLESTEGGDFDVAQFAAPSNQITPDSLDQLVDLLGDSAREGLSDWLDAVRTALAAATDEEDFSRRLLALDRDLPQDALAQTFREALVAASLKGVIDAGAISGNDDG